MDSTIHQRCLIGHSNNPNCDYSFSLLTITRWLESVDKDITYSLEDRKIILILTLKLPPCLLVLANEEKRHAKLIVFYGKCYFPMNCYCKTHWFVSKFFCPRQQQTEVKNSNSCLNHNIHSFWKPVLRIMLLKRLLMELCITL